MNLGLPATTLLLLLTAGSVIAAVYFTLPIPSSVRVLSYEIEAWNEDKTALITSFDFGTLMPTEQSISETFWVKNIGDTLAYFGWRCDDLPSGFELKLQTESSPGVWTDQVPLPSWIGALNPNEYYATHFRVVLTNINNSTSGAYSFTVYLDSGDG